MEDLHVHIHLDRNQPTRRIWQQLAVLATLGAFVLAGLPWLGVNPIQPGPAVPVQVTVLQSPGGLIASSAIKVPAPGPQRAQIVVCHADAEWYTRMDGLPSSRARSVGRSSSLGHKGQMPEKPLHPCLLHSFNRRSSVGVPFHVCATVSLRPSASAFLVSLAPEPNRCCPYRRSRLLENPR